ncbi:hydroxyacid dehydrogenase [Patescibacteria group bacterium]|nr:hydroxyacid dehydrogenase [Patescibacteria group bacterium]
MPKIVITQNLELFPDQAERLKSLGDTTFYNDLAKSPDEWLWRCHGADIICAGGFGLKQKLYEIKNAFLSLPFVNVSWIDKEKIKENNVVVSYCPGCNKDAVSEWIIAMMLNLFRQLPKFINVKDLPKGKIPDFTLGLTGKKVAILGKGNIGSRAGKICEAFDMKVVYFKRGNDLFKCVKDANVVINCLSSNSSTWGLLGKKFFNSLKRGCYFISPSDEKIYDVNALLDALDNGTLAGIADDAGGARAGDCYDSFYVKLSNNPKVLVTPHIAYQTDVTAKVANDMMISNIEAWLKGEPINLLK